MVSATQSVKVIGATEPKASGDQLQAQGTDARVFHTNCQLTRSQSRESLAIPGQESLLALKSKDQPDFVEICHNFSKEDKDDDDLLYMIHGRSERRKTKVELNASNLINKMEVFWKYKTANILRHTSDPFCLILKMVSKTSTMVHRKW